MIAVKSCSKCGQMKPMTPDFFNKKGDRFTSQCRPCRNESRRHEWSEASSSLNAARRLNRQLRGDEVRASDRAKYAANPDKKREQVYAWRQRNPDKVVAINAASYSKHSEKKKDQARKWAQANPEKRKAISRSLHRRRMDSCPKYRVNRSIRAYLTWQLRDGKVGRRTEAILGYSIDDLMRHIEKQFVNGMDWSNYGEWHIDHIIPVASFEFDSPYSPEFKRCWSLPNLRPCWARENLAKSDKRLFLI